MAIYKLFPFSLLLVYYHTADAQTYQRSVQVELSDQENNRLRTSMPGVGCWFWIEREFSPGGYRPFIDLYTRHTNIRFLTTSIRHDRWIDDQSVYEQVKAAADYARANDMALVFDLDVRLARKSFRDKYPGEQQELVRMRETEPMDSGTIYISIEGMKSGDHYTFGPAPDYDSYSSRLLRVYSYAQQGHDIRDITDRCSILKSDGDTLKVTIPSSNNDKGRKALVMAAFTMYTPDLFSPYLPVFEREVLEKYDGAALAGACKDEWGFPGRFEPSPSDLWYSENMAKAYSERRPGHDLARDMLLMFMEDYDRPSERTAALNHYMQMVWQRCAGVENMFYDSVKEVFGDSAMVMTHPTWFPYPNNLEIFKNGLDWWVVKRDLAQTDESTPYCVRTALAKKWNSPLWYNMYYNSDIEAYKPELWRSVLGGGRINYHQLFPYDDWLTDPEWNKALLKDSLMQAEARIQLLNYISTKPVDCPVAVIFGHPAALNWLEQGFGDAGLKITDKLWEAGYYADLIPSSEIMASALKTDEDGAVRYGEQRYAAAVLYNPEYENPGTAAFFQRAAAGGRTRLYRTGSWTRDFEGIPFDGNAALPESMTGMSMDEAVSDIIGFLEKQGYETYTKSTPGSTHFTSSMMPGVCGRLHLLDGTVIHASGERSVMGDPIRRTISAGGRKVKFDCAGIAAVRLDDHGKLEAMAAGELGSFRGGGVKITMPDRADIALWKDSKGEWHGILQGYEGPVPGSLARICKNWTRLRLPENMIEK